MWTYLRLRHPGQTSVCIVAVNRSTTNDAYWACRAGRPRSTAILGADARLFDDILKFSEQRAVEASAILQFRVVSNGFKRLTSKSAKSVMLRVTTVSL